MTPSPAELRDLCTRAATELGFHRVGIASLAPPRTSEAYRRWLEAGYHGEMGYMAAPDHVAARADYDRVARGARTAVVVAAAYGHRDPDLAPGGGPRGRIARYARGADYHGVLKRRLAELGERLAAAAGRAVLVRPCVDSAPVLERELAERAGIGFVGKNTMLITPGLGSYTVLGELFTDLEIEPTEAGRLGAASRCGECRACLDACPTGALVAPFSLDGRRCISYLTIELRGEVPEPLRPAIGDMVFGCDICQEVCPYNAAAPARTPADPELGAEAPPERARPDLAELAAMGSGAWRRWLAGSAMRRAGRAGMLRNVCIALGNSGDPRAEAPLRELLSDPSEVVRRAARWGLERLGIEAP